MSEKVFICPNCETKYKSRPNFCTKCGQALEQLPANSGQTDSKSNSFLGAIKEVLWPGTSEKGISEERSSPETLPPLSAVQPTMPLTASHLSEASLIEDHYVVLKRYPLSHSNYYDVYDLNCYQCNRQSHPTPAGTCAHCHTLLPRYLVRESKETRAEARGNLDKTKLIQLSQNKPFVIPHHQIRQYDDRTLIWLRSPTQWRSLAKVKLPVGTQQLVIWGQHMAGALAALSGYTYYDPHPSGIEKIIIEGGIAHLADLTSCRRIETDQTGISIGRDTAFLARVLYYLSTGRHVNKSNQVDTGSLIPSLRTIIEQGIQGKYQSIDEMADDLSRVRTGNDYGTSPKPNSGKASDPGQVRQNNEDSLVVLEMTRVQESRGVPIGLYVVADGMGGHQAGEIASRTVNKIITERVINAEVIPDLKFATRRLDATPEAVLRSAIQKANRTLHHQAQAKESNMGTTLTAALLIGDTATIANVGDSRTYLLRRGELKQITADHSLVASLVAAGVIQPEEVREHPQRNQIFRSLGDKSEVEVDIFTERLQQGDQLILCSDGLWEMISDVEMHRQLQAASTPQAACNALIQQANLAGGEDNVTVIVVKLE